MIPRNLTGGFSVDLGNDPAQHWGAVDPPDRWVAFKALGVALHLVALNVDKEVGWRDVR